MQYNSYYYYKNTFAIRYNVRGFCVCFEDGINTVLRCKDSTESEPPPHILNVDDFARAEQAPQAVCFFCFFCCCFFCCFSSVVLDSGIFVSGVVIVLVVATGGGGGGGAGSGSDRGRGG